MKMKVFNKEICQNQVLNQLVNQPQVEIGSSYFLALSPLAPEELVTNDLDNELTCLELAQPSNDIFKVINENEIKGSINRHHQKLHSWTGRKGPLPKGDHDQQMKNPYTSSKNTYHSIQKLNSIEN